MKISKKIVSLLLAATMILSCFAIAIPFISLKTSAATINGITQSYIVPEASRDSVYASYASAYLNGYSEPTKLLIPGLSKANNYVVQGMAYYPEKNWALITAYHNDGSSPSMVYCMDIATGDFVAMFSFLNVDGTPNTDHGGGIAVSEHNIYYSCGDMDRSIAYAPLSAIEGIENDATKYRAIQLVAEQTFYETGSVTDGDKTAYTAYCCYDQGVLWTGNFYDKGVAGIIAADYNVKAHSNHNSMVWGYELSGNSSAEEWANLTSNTQNCQGNPSYVIALPNDIIDVQYATVDDGRLYLSRSYGTGTETCINFGMKESSQLSITDIDLTVPGNASITFTTDANGTQRTVNNAYSISASDIKTFDFMPMSEGLCIIDDYVYMTFESACYKYYEDAGIMGNCDLPIDVVWKIDQYGLLGHERPDEKDVTAYQKVMSLSEISATDEYMVVYESEMKAEGNQNNIIYALDSYGGYKGDRLPKTDAGTQANTLDSMGMIGHEITDYHKYTNADGDEFLVLDNPQDDDAPNIRWNLIGAGTDSTRIHSVSLYNASYSYLYFDSRLIYMSTMDNSNLDSIKFAEKEINGVKYPGDFYIHNNSTNFLWCNDGSNESWMKAYDDYYLKGDSTKKYFNEKEVPGTFHTDGLKRNNADSSGNQAGALPAPYKLGTFNIYKRITIDPETMGGTGLETDLKAELQPDGTYTINMGTYATSEAHKYLGESGLPTDFMFVLDASGSMTNKTDYVTYQSQGNLAISRGMANNDPGYYVYVDEVIKDDGSILTVNQFCKLNGHYSGILMWAKYWVSADATDGNEYFVNTDGKFYWRDSQITTVGGSDTTITDKLPVYRKVTTSRLQGMKDTVNSFISKIDANAQTYNIEHRVGIVTFGSDGNDENSPAYLNTGVYSTLGGTTLNQYGYDDLTAHYAAAFYPSNHSNLKTIVNSITTDVQDTDPDTFANYGMEMAVNCYAKQSPAFGGSGDRYYADFTDSEGILHEKNANAVVIFLTDGCPGKGGSNVESATNVSNSTIPSSGAIKANGGVVYSVQISNATMDGFDMAAYMNGVSSNYPTASSLTSLGTKSSSDYYVKAATDGSVDVAMVLNNVFEHIENNYIDVGTAITLDEDSIVRQKLGSNFKLTEKSTVTITTSSITEDVIGNITFGNGVANNSVSATFNVANNTVQVTGFDYSSNYYAKNAKDGKRLNIIIDNVLPVDTDEASMNISNGTYTAIYENADNMNANKKFKGYPNAAFSITEYTYVLDYGMQMLDTDINGTIKSVSDTLSKQADANGNIKYNTSDAQGTVAIADNGLNLKYSITPSQTAMDKNYVLIQRNNGEYDWFQINVVPASNVYYEQSSFAKGTAGKASWENDGTQTFYYQSPGNDPKTDVHGYDNNYADSKNGHSNGVASKVTLNQDAKKSDSQKFTFYGTGFDLVSACGPTTGILTVKVTDSTGKLVKAYIVDTYYGYSTATGSPITLNENGLLCQVPVVSFKNDSGVAQSYNVEVTAVYLSTSNALAPQQASITETETEDGIEVTTAVVTDNSAIYDELAALGMHDLVNADLEFVWFDDNSILNGGTGAYGTEDGLEMADDATENLYCYLDGLRIYHPLGSNSSEYIASEQGATYLNVINEITNGKIGTDLTNIGNFAYIGRDLTDSETLSFADYQNEGPQNELYLKPGSGSLAFKVEFGINSAKIHLGLRAVNGTSSVTIGSGDKAAVFDINSATEMYYDITDLLSVDSNTGIATITIQNTGSAGVLAVNNVKLTQGGNVSPITEDDLNMFSLAMSAPAEEAFVVNGKVTTEKVEEELPPENEEIPAELTKWEKALAFIKDIFAKVIAFFSDVFVFLTKGGMF